MLLCIQALFQDAEDLTERYDLWQLTKSRNRDSKSTNPVFADTFARFEDEIQETQQQASVWKAARWAIHDEQKFSLLINDVKELVTSLLQITEALESIERQQSKLQQEIEKISDVENLLVLEEAVENDASLLDTISDQLSRVSSYSTTSLSSSVSTASSSTLTGGTIKDNSPPILAS